MHILFASMEQQTWFDMIPEELNTLIWKAVFQDT